jgi:hypothetical protein
MVGYRTVAVLGVLTAVGTVGACSSSYGTTDDSAGDSGPDATSGDAGSGSETATSDASDGATAPRGAHLFSRSFGGPDEDYITRANVDLSGNLLLAGSFATTVDFGTGPLTSQGALDIYFAKFDPSGKAVFATAYGDVAEQNGVNIVGTGSGDIYATGVFRGQVLGSVGYTATDSEPDALVLRLGPDGLLKESFVLPGSGRQFVNGLAYDGSHGVFFSGFNNGAVPGANGITTAGGNDFVVGHGVSTQNWTRDLGDPSEQFSQDIAYDPAGSVVAVGYFGGTVDFGTGIMPVTSAGGYDVLVTRFTAAGAPVWGRAFGGAGDQQASFVAVSGGEIIVVGTFTGTMKIATDVSSAGAIDVFVAKLAADGSPIWSKRFGGAADDTVGGLAVAPNGDILIGGRTNGDIDFGLGALPAAGDGDAYVARLDKNGDAIWAKRFGDAAFQSVNGVGVTLTGEVWVAGYYTGTIDLGGGPFTSKGKHDIFIARFAP